MGGPAAPDTAAGRVLVYAPIGRDATLTAEVLARGGIAAHVCVSAADLCAHIDEGVGAVVLTEEAMHDPGLAQFVELLDDQPPWSDLTTLLFVGSGERAAPAEARRYVDRIRNVTLLERPIRIAAVLSAVRSALRGRQRQYEVRDLLVALHRARGEAEHANRLKDEFLATLSHELRTPLNAILGWTAMLRHNQVPADRMPRVFDTLDRNAQAQAQLIADVLDVSRIITGKLTVQSQPVDLATIVLDALDAVRPAALTKGVELALHIDEAVVVRGDRARLQQVFWNLLSNAVKFTPDGGRVEVAAAVADGRVEVTVADTGVGISAEFLPFVFDRFRQADQTTTRVHGGLGLGLAIVRHLTELHGGSVAVESEGPGRGARFRVSLPVHHARTRQRVERRRPEPAAVPREFALSFDGATILIVDDDAATRELLVTLLGGAGATVLVSASAPEAFGLLGRHRPALVIADIGMPGENGLSLLRRIRAAGEPWSDVPAIALSAYAGSRTEEDARAAGFRAFLAKPARPHELLRLVDAVLK